MNENANLDRPAFQILPYSINPTYVIIDSTNAHFPTVTDDFVMMRPWYSGDDSLRTGQRYYMAFTYDISDTTPDTTLNCFYYTNFDTNTVGTLPPEWVIRYEGLGDAYQIVTNAYYHSSPHSLQVWGEHCWSAVLIMSIPDSLRSERMYAEAWMMTTGIDTIDDFCGNGHGTIFFRSDEGTWGQMYGHAAFDEFGNVYTGYSRTIDSLYEIAEGHPYVPGEWVFVQLLTDYVTDSFHVIVNNSAYGHYQGAWTGGTGFTQFSLSSEHAGIPTYFDDIHVCSGWPEGWRPSVAVKGWTHPRRDIVGSCYYPWGSTVLSNSVVVKWTRSVPGASGSLPQWSILSADVNGDGNIELVTIQKDTLFIFGLGGTVLTRTYIGISGQTGRSWVTMLEDETGDSIAEIGIGYWRDYFSSGNWKTRIYSGTGTLLKEFTKTGSADGGMRPITMIGQDLIIAQACDYVGSPRGFSRWSYASATELWQYDVGPHLSGDDYSIADINLDGFKELSWSTFTPHNGYSGSSGPLGDLTSDGDCWTIIINEDGDSFHTSIWPRAERDGYLSNMLFRFKDTSPYRIISFKHPDTTYYPGRAIIYVRNTSGAVLDSLLGFRYNGWSFGFADMNGDGVREIVCGNDTTTCTKIFILDSLLHKVDSLVTSRGYTVRAICDFDGDGNNEIIIANRDSASVVCLSRTLDEK